MQKFTLACEMAARWHGQQQRKGEGLPYIVHPLEVARILADCGETNGDILCAAVLHDVLEDGNVTLATLTETFGRVVSHMVEEVTDDKCIRKGTRKRLQAENLPKKSHGAKLIKMADKISNCRSMMEKEKWPKGWTEQNVYEYLIWSFRMLYAVRNESEGLWNIFLGVVNGVNCNALHSQKLDSYIRLYQKCGVISSDMIEEVNAYYERCDAPEKN